MTKRIARQLTFALASMSFLAVLGLAGWIESL